MFLRDVGIGLAPEARCLSGRSLDRHALGQSFDIVGGAA